MTPTLSRPIEVILDFSCPLVARATGLYRSHISHDLEGWRPTNNDKCACGAGKGVSGPVSRNTQVTLQFLLIILLFVTANSLLNIEPASAFSGNDQLNHVPYSPESPTIDGFLDSDEWEGASVKRVKQDSDHVAMVGSTFNNEKLFIFVSVDSDITDLDDNVFICFDIENDGGETWDTGDYCFHIHSEKPGTTGVSVQQGQPDKPFFESIYPIPASVEMAAGFSSFNGIRELKPHRTYELAVPILLLGKDVTKVGFAVYYYDKGYGLPLAWPESAEIKSTFCLAGGREGGEEVFPYLTYCPGRPDSWGELIAAYPMPELSTSAALLPIILALAIIITSTRILRFHLAKNCT